MMTIGGTGHAGVIRKLWMIQYPACSIVQSVIHMLPKSLTSMLHILHIFIFIFKSDHQNIPVILVSIMLLYR